jgi:hypothetical protein
MEHQGWPSSSTLQEDPPMQKVLSLIHEVASRGLTVGKAVIQVGKATVEIVVRVFLTK